jgi:hypothetical protein
VATKKVEWPVSSTGADKAALKDDCFELPEPGSAMAKQIAAENAATRARMVASGKIKLKPKK